MKRLFFIAVACWVARPAFAQDSLAQESLPPEIAAVIARAEQSGLPTGPLEAKALEGLAKGVQPARIAGVIAGLEAAMAATAAALGEHLSPHDPTGHLVAGGAALSAGASDAALRTLAAAEAHIEATRALADLLIHGFSEPQALELVLDAVRAADPATALIGLSTTAAALVSSGLTPTAASEQLNNGNGNGNGQGNGNAYAYGHDKKPEKDRGPKVK
jgi:hypothetical protein